jgi:hypothetical protein
VVAAVAAVVNRLQAVPGRVALPRG